jgi:hypothetical protein
MNSDDSKLSALLRQSRVTPPLAPRFQENVWRRIEDAEASVKVPSWLDLLAGFVLRPRYAYAAIVALVLAGMLIGVHEGAQSFKQDAQARYIAVVAPNALR